MGQITVCLDNVLRAYQHAGHTAMTIETLAHDTGIAPAVLAALRDNQAEQLSLADLAQLCDALHCTPHDLLEYTPASGDGEEHTAVESRHIVERWHERYGADEHPGELAGS